MSAIGDYIHLTYTGYVKGPELGSGKPPFLESYGAAMINRENHFNQWMQKQESPIIKDLEKETQASLDLLKSFKENKGNTSQVEENEMAMALLDDLWNELDTKYMNIDRIAAAASGLLNSSGFGSGRNVGKNGANTFRQQSIVSNINQQIQNVLDTTLLEINNSINQLLTPQEIKINKISQINTKTQANIKNFMSQLQNQFKTLDTSTNKATAAQLNTIFNELKIVIQSNEKLNNNIDIEGLLNTLAFGLSGGMAANQYKGDISEALISVMGERLAGLALSSTDAIIKEAVVTGQERSSRGILTGKFSSDVDWTKALAGKKFKQPFGDRFIVSADAVQDKVDIAIEVDGGQSAYISAKNYNTKNLQKGVKNTSASFLTLIQNENQNDLINHYLNLNAVNGKGRQSLKPNMEAINNLIRKITIAKLITGYKTVTGENGQTMKEANVFAVFNSDTYQVKFYNMKDVLEGVFSGGRYKSMYIPSYFYKSNTKTTDFHTRLNNVIKQLNVAATYTLKEDEYNK